jgi:hypothetical protein
VWAQEHEARWQQLAEEVFVGIKEWRLQHPKASFAEIERALDERLARVRARLLEDVALASAAADLPAVPPAARPHCPDCGQPLEARGRQTRQVRTHHEQAVRLRRSYAVCPSCRTGLFPPG